MNTKSSFSNDTFYWNDDSDDQFPHGNQIAVLLFGHNASNTFDLHWVTKKLIKSIYSEKFVRNRSTLRYMMQSRVSGYPFIFKNVLLFAFIYILSYFWSDIGKSNNMFITWLKIASCNIIHIFLYWKKLGPSKKKDWTQGCHWKSPIIFWNSPLFFSKIWEYLENYWKFCFKILDLTTNKFNI